MKHFLVFSLVSQLLVAPVSAQTLNQAFEGSSNKPLTDQEQQTANNYYHTGKAEKILEDECKKLGQTYSPSTQACTDTGAGSVFGGGMGGMIEEMLPKLYGIMGTAAMASGGAKIQMKPKSDGAGTSGGQAQGQGQTQGQGQGQGQGENKGEEKQDVCIYIPMAGEVIASGMQMMGQNQIQQQTVAKNGADLQKDSLYAVARTHDTRAKTARIQGGIYGATAGCYVAYIATGAVVDWKIMLKTGAAAAMSTIFFIKAGKESKFADNIRNIAKKLPGAGDCNPYTQTNCFCAEPTSRNMDLSSWNKVCVPQQLAGNSTGTKTAIPCATLSSNGGATLDAECKCKKTNSCLNGQIANLANQIGFGGTELADPLRLLNDMNGSMDDANVEKFGTQLSARAKGLVNKTPIGDVPSFSLDKKNSGLAKELNKMGLPAAMAAYAASQPGGSAPTSSSAGTLSADTSASDDPTYTSKKGVSYGYAGSSGGRRNNGSDSFKMPGDKGKENSVQIDTFAEQAMAAAEINKDTSVGIFDVISNRYRRSAWSRFEMDKLMQQAATDAPAPAAQAPVENKPVQ